MKMYVATLLLILLLPGFAFAQTACPQGVPAGDPRCGPGSGSGLPAPAPAIPKMRWNMTWGAIAKDSRTGSMGYASGQSSRRAATRAAIAACGKSGGSKCAVKLTYENQCAVVVEPADESMTFVTTVFRGASTIEEASSKATQDCERMNGGAACKVYYENCTAPVPVYE